MLKQPLATRLVLAATLLLPLSAPAFAADSYTLDPSHTAVVWHINHFGFSKPSGKFTNITGTLTLDVKNLAASTITATIPVDSLVTGIAKLDEHLRSKDFFDLATYPTASFTSTKVTFRGSNASTRDGGGSIATVEGTLTLHGVTKPVTLDVVLNKIGVNMFKKKTAGFSATTTIKRSDFGMTTYLPGLGDEIRLEIESEANIAAGD